MDSTSPVPAIDHRRMRRRPAKKSVNVICRKGTMGLGANVGIRVVDISVDGVQLIVKTAFNKGDEVEVVLSATGISGNLSREATVAWCSAPVQEGFILGVKFRQPLAYDHIFYMT